MAPSTDRQDWDKYVTDVAPKFTQRSDVRWPGDEWGDEGVWRETFESLLLPAGAADWKQAVEIGQGAGKYTKLLFDAAPECKVFAFDVSSEYLKVCGERLAAEVENGRLVLEHLAGERSDEMILALERHGVAGTLDGFFSIDAMVHVDLQYMIPYFLTAAVVLREGGHLVMTLADASTEAGFEFLVSRASAFYGSGGDPLGKFEWMSRDIARSIVERLGFEVIRCESPPDNDGRDIHLIARLVDRDAARRASWAIVHEELKDRRRVEHPTSSPPVLEWPQVENAERYTIEFSQNRFGTLFDTGLGGLELPAGADREFRIPGDFWSGYQAARPLFWRVVAECPDRLRIPNRGIVVRSAD